MQRLILLLTILVFVLIQSPGVVFARTMDTQGDAHWPDKCNAPYMESHTINADGKSTFKFHGQCFYSNDAASPTAWNEHYSITATWDGSQAKEIVTMKGQTGTAISTCPADPWLNKVTCQKQSTSGNVFKYYRITGLVFPLTNNVLKEDQRAQLRAELETKRKEANCIIPVVVAPVPKDGLQVQSPASVRISIKHGIDAVPKDWVISWAPLQKPGEWPTPSVQQNISLNGLTTKQGVTTGILNVVKPGRWSVITKVDIPSYCNIGLQAIPGASFIVTDRSAGESAGEILKDKRPGPLQTPKEGNTGIAPTLQQKQTLPSQQRR